MTMRKFKKALCVFAAVAMMLCLSSCMAMENGLIINADGSIRLFCDTTVEEEMLSSMEMTKEDFVQSIKDSESSESYEGFETEVIETTIDGKNHVGCRYYKDMTVDEVNSYVQGDANVKSSYSIVEEGGKLTVTITYTNSSEEGVESTDEMSQYVAEGMMTTKQSVTAPYEVIETNGTVDEATGTVTWDTLEVFMGTVKEATYTVTYKVSSGAPLGLIFGIVAAVLIITAAVIAFLVIKKNKEPQIPQAAADFSMPAETNSVQTAAPVQEPAQEAPAEEEAPAAEQPQEKVCAICGAKVSADDQFCSVCGERV